MINHHHLPTSNGTGNRTTCDRLKKQQQPQHQQQQLLHDERILQLKQDYERRISQLGAENEELKSEIYLINHDLQKAVEEKEELYKLLEEKERKMTEQLDIVTRTAYALYEKIRAFKVRYYGNAWSQAQQRCE